MNNFKFILLSFFVLFISLFTACNEKDDLGSLDSTSPMSSSKTIADTDRLNLNAPLNELIKLDLDKDGSFFVNESQTKLIDKVAQSDEILNFTKFSIAQIEKVKITRDLHTGQQYFSLINVINKVGQRHCLFFPIDPISNRIMPISNDCIANSTCSECVVSNSNCGCYDLDGHTGACENG